jgi:tRNA dimethylallyltransferase
MIRDPRPPLLVLFGPTASGKSALAHRVALARDGEIVSADAFAVYRGFDVGTAKPGPKERAEVPYHALDVADPRETYSAGRWAHTAREAIGEIAARGRLPIVCGGSGFYIDALLKGLPGDEAADAALRRRLSEWGRTRQDEAHRFLALNDPESATRIPVGNLRYTLRALEVLLLTGRPASARRTDRPELLSRFRVVCAGLRLSREDLHARIAARVREMLDRGWGEEVRHLLGSGLPLEANAFQAIGYREVADWVAGRIDRAEAEARIVASTRQLAKRQKTWFARERDAVWLEPDGALEALMIRLDGPEKTERNG